jgi:2-dehydropantoate 2-reductase
MRIAVMGTGAVGGYFGARLAASGLDVSFIGRGEHLRAMRDHGLKIKSVQGDLEIHSKFTDNPTDIGSVDLVLFCVKSQDTEEAAKSLAPLMREKTTVLSLQNGVDNQEKIARLWGADRTVIGVVYIASRIAGPGVIEHSAGGRMVLGPLNPAAQESSRDIATVLAGARISCEVSSDIDAVLWKKLAWNAPFCALACLLRMTVGEILAEESVRPVITGCIEEVRAAAHCRGIALQPCTAEETLRFSRSLGNAKPSMLQDLEAGKPLEYEALNGVVIKILRETGQRAPINEIFYASLKHIDQEPRDRQKRRDH